VPLKIDDPVFSQRKSCPDRTKGTLNFFQGKNQTTWKGWMGKWEASCPCPSAYESSGMSSHSYPVWLNGKINYTLLKTFASFHSAHAPSLLHSWFSVCGRPKTSRKENQSPNPDSDRNVSTPRFSWTGWRETWDGQWQRREIPNHTPNLQTSHNY